MKKLFFYILCLLLVSCGAKEYSNKELKQFELYETLNLILLRQQNENGDIFRQLTKNVYVNMLDAKRATIILQKSDSLRNMTSHIIGFIENTKEKIYNLIGEGHDEKHHFVKKPLETKGLYDLMTNSYGKNKALELQKLLDSYTKYLYQSFKEYHKNESKLTNTPAKKEFSSYYFENTNVIDALMSLTQMQISICRYEKACLERINPKITPPSIGLYAETQAESQKVQEGDDYVAYLYITYVNSREGALMWANGMPIKVDETGVGKVRWKATGIGKKKWTGKIKTTYMGRDTTFIAHTEYEVVPKVK